MVGHADEVAEDQDVQYAALHTWIGEVELFAFTTGAGVLDEHPPGAGSRQDPPAGTGVTVSAHAAGLGPVTRYPTSGPPPLGSRDVADEGDKPVSNGSSVPRHAARRLSMLSDGGIGR